MKLVLGALLGLAHAANLYVSSYDGHLTTLSLTSGSAHKQCRSGTLKARAQAKLQVEYKLTNTGNIKTHAQSPSWLTYEKKNDVLYMMDEAMVSGSGSLTSYHTSPKGELTQVQRLKASPGGVYGTFYTFNAPVSAFAVAHYASSSLQTYTMDLTGHMKPLETFKYLLIPDLGADLVRVYLIDNKTGKLTASTPLKAKAGSGPRHGLFLPNLDGGKDVFYLLAELDGTVTAYTVDYPKKGGMLFTLLPNGVYDVRGPGKHPYREPGTGAAPAELSLSSDLKYLIASVRKYAVYKANMPGNPFPEPSDTLITWLVTKKPNYGALEFLQQVPSGGSYPKHFSLNKAGDLVAVGLQQGNSKVAIIERDPASGKFGKVVASVPISGNVTCVVWDE